MFLIRLPERIPVNAALAFVGLLAAAQLIEGTTPFLMIGCAAFTLLSVWAFNVAGGMVYPSGAYIMFCALLTVIVGMVAKVFLGEPMQGNLLTPEKTIWVYVVGMASMLAAVMVTRELRPKRALLQGLNNRGNASATAAICLVISIAIPLFLPDELKSTFRQGNNLMLVAILLTVFDKVKSTDGRRSFSIVGLLAWAYPTFFGFVAFSKEGMFTPSAAWAIAAIAAGYRMSLRKGVTLGVCAVVAVGILTPYSQVGRDIGRGLPVAVALEIGWGLLQDPIALRKSYLQQEGEDLAGGNTYHLFNGPQGLLDRLNMFAVDDALINLTDKGDKAPASNLWSYFENLVPRYLNPDKKTLSWGNVYAKPLGLVGEGDDTTGISFSAFGDGYHTGLWVGVSIYSFGIFLFSFLIMDSVGGSAQLSLWPLLFIVLAAHGAPEGMLGEPVYMGGTYSLFVIVGAVLCSKILPEITKVFTGPPKPEPYVAVDSRNYVQSV